jgi:hypothetical protein
MSYNNKSIPKFSMDILQDSCHSFRFTGVIKTSQSGREMAKPNPSRRLDKDGVEWKKWYEAAKARCVWGKYSSKTGI